MIKKISNEMQINEINMYTIGKNKMIVCTLP